MDLKQLIYFAEIVNSGFNLSRAAENLHITQPSLSMLISDLEKYHNIKFFKKKGSRYVELTEEGKILFEDAKKIINNIGELEFKLKKIKKDYAGTVKIGIPPIIISLFFNKLISKFIVDYPNVNLVIIENGANDLIRMIKNKEIDFAVLVGEGGTLEGIESHKLCNDTLAAFVSDRHRFFTKEELEFEELENEKIVLLSDNFILHTVIMNTFKAKKLTPNVVFTSGQWDLLVQMTEDEEILTILPKSIESKISSTHIKRISFNPELNWTINLSKNCNYINNPTSLLLENFIYDFFNKEFRGD